MNNKAKSIFDVLLLDQDNIHPLHNTLDNKSIKYKFEGDYITYPKNLDYNYLD
jgi:hypothetical protein